MARDRKRSKQRQQRRARTPGDAIAPIDDAAPPIDDVTAPIDDDIAVDPFEDPTADPVFATAAEPDFDEPVRPAMRGSDYDELADESLKGDAVAEVRAPRAPARPAKGNRVTGFLRASWAELQRVQWPTRQQVFQATAVVLGFVVVAGAYLAGADYVAGKIVDAIL